MKKFKLITALLSSALILAGCKGEEPKPVDECDHVMKDTNQDGICDSCQKEVGHADADQDGKCDYCGKDMQEPAEPTVKSVSIEGKVAELEIGKTVDLTAKIVVENGAAQGIKWSVSNDNASLSATSGKDVTVTGLKAGKVTVKAASTFDPTKFDEVEIEVKEPEVTDWSDADKQLMETNLGIVLPFFKGDFEWYESRGSLIGESENADDAANAIAVFDALDVEKVDYGSYIEYTLDGAEEGFAVAVQVGQTSTGAVVFAYSYRYVWPADELAAFTSEHTDEVVPAAEGEEFDASYNSAAAAYIIDVYGGNLSGYLATLSSGGWLIADLSQIPEAGYYDAMSPKGNLEVAIFPYSNFYRIGVFYADPLPTEWPAEALSLFIGDHSIDALPVAEGKFFDGGLLKSGDFGIDVYGGNIQDYAGQLELAGYEVKDFYESDGVYECTSSSYTLKVTLYDLVEYGYPAGTFEIQVKLINPTPFPAEQIAEFIGSHTDETVPEANGAHFDFFSVQGIFVFNVHGGNLTEYLSALESANYVVSFDTEDEIYSANSEKGFLKLVIVPDTNESYQVQVSKTYPTFEEWPADQIVDFIDGYTTEVVPAVEGTSFAAHVQTSPYEAFIIDVTGGDANAYASALYGSGWSVKVVQNAYYDCVSPEGTLELAVFPGNGMCEIQVMLAWSKDTLDLMKSFIGEELPFFRGIESWYDYGGMLEGYISSMDYVSNIISTFIDYEWVGGYDEYSGSYVFQKESDAMEGYIVIANIYSEYGGLYIDVYLSVPVIEAWPAENVAAYIGDHSDTVVPAAAGDGYQDYGASLTSYQVVVIGGDSNAYISSLVEAGFTFESYYYSTGYVYCSADEKVTINIAEDYGAFYVSIYLTEPKVAAPFPNEAVAAYIDNRTEETVPECFGTNFSADVLGDSLYISVTQGKVNDYVAALQEAGWTLDHTPGTYFYNLESPNETLEMEIQTNSANIDFDIVLTYSPKFAEWPAVAVASILGEKAKIALPGSSALDAKYRVQQSATNQATIRVYGSTAEAYVADLTTAGFAITEGGADSGYWYLLSEDKTVKVVVYDDMAEGCDFFRVIATGQDPSWTESSFNASTVENYLGLEANSIPAIEKGSKFTYTLKSETIITVSVTGGKMSEYQEALIAAGFTNTTSGVYQKDNIIVNLTSNNVYGTSFTAKYTLDDTPPAPAKTLLELVQECMGTSEEIPMPCDDANQFTKRGEKDCHIRVSNGDAAAYAEALLGAGYSKTGDSGDFLSFVKGDITIEIDMTMGGSNSTFAVYIFATPAE